jgi:cAMP-specific phosphodiesterase 4
VAQTLAHFIFECNLGKLISYTLKFAALLAAIVHDVGHPGVNNLFLIASKHKLALTYNDKSPLENMHANFAFEVMLVDKCNVLGNFPKDQVLGIRRAMIEMILATDNAKHAKYLDILNTRISKGDMFDEKSGVEDQITLLRIALHAADVSNPAKRVDLYKKWTGFIVEEFYCQGDKERELDLPIGAINDRKNPIPEAKFQVGFISAIVLPLYNSFSRIPGMNISHCVDMLNKNLQMWKTDGP